MDLDLASEMLQDLKKESRRKQIIIYILVAVIVLLVVLGMVERLFYDYTTVDIDSSDGGNANYIGEDGTIINGKDYCTTQNGQIEPIQSTAH